MNSLNDLPPAILKTDIPEFPVKRGKVRDVYDLGETLAFVATDRISAFDWVMPDGIPEKGKLLTEMTIFWFEEMRRLIPELQNHFITNDVTEYPARLQKHRSVLEGRSMLVRKATVAPVECIARGYITGSGWKEYSGKVRGKKKGEICGIPLPEGLLESQQLPEPIFTPSTKAEVGLHDDNIDFDRMVELVGSRETAERLRDMTLLVYRKAAEIANAQGIILADTKFEWGMNGMLIDEVLTPDSSRFWPKDQHKIGGPVPSFDKQFLRDWLETTGWDKKSPPPRLPEQVILQTHDKYKEGHNRITGKKAEM